MGMATSRVPGTEWVPRNSSSALSRPGGENMPQDFLLTLEIGLKVVIRPEVHFN